MNQFPCAADPLVSSKPTSSGMERKVWAESNAKVKLSVVPGDFPGRRFRSLEFDMKAVLFNSSWMAHSFTYMSNFFGAEH